MAQSWLAPTDSRRNSSTRQQPPNNSMAVRAMNNSICPWAAAKWQTLVSGSPAVPQPHCSTPINNCPTRALQSHTHCLPDSANSSSPLPNWVLCLPAGNLFRKCKTMSLFSGGYPVPESVCQVQHVVSSTVDDELIKSVSRAYELTYVHYLPRRWDQQLEMDAQQVERLRNMVTN